MTNIKAGTAVGQLIGDELYFAPGNLKAGLRLLVLSDGCRAGIRAGLPTRQSANLFTLGGAGNFLTQVSFMV